MKIEQILLAVEIDKCGSLSKAAQKLFLSQPNASNTIQSLEKEIGYNIFERKNSGMCLTKNGEVFIRYAHTLLRTAENIRMVDTEKYPFRFSVFSPSYSFTGAAFARLCSEYLNNSGKSDFLYQVNNNDHDAIEKLNNNEIDIAILTCVDDISTVYASALKKVGLAALHICYSPLQISLSCKHPLSKLKNITLEDCFQYPCITGKYFRGTDFHTPSNLHDFVPFLNTSITVDSDEIGYSIASTSNAIIISTPFDAQLLEQYNLISKDIHGIKLKLFALVCKERMDDPLIKRFLEFVKDEIVKHDFDVIA